MTALTTAVTPDTPKLDAMLAYAAHGWKTFMLSASKSPVRNCEPCTEQHVTSEQREACQCLQCHGFYAATTDPDRIREMVRRTPGGMVAVRTGIVSGIVVIDIDTQDAHGVDGVKTSIRLDRAGVLPGTVTANSASGGTHLVYAHPGGRLKGGAHKLGPGVDVKADGGYFVVAPSRSPKTGAPYRWVGDRFDLPLTPLHPRIVAHLQEKPPPVPVDRGVMLPRTQDRYVAAAVQGEVQRVLDARSNGLGRNDELNKAAFVLGTLVGAGALSQSVAEDALTQAAIAVGLDQDTNCNMQQIAATIRSGINTGIRSPRNLGGVR